MIIEFVPTESINPSPENDLLYGAVDTSCIEFVNMVNDVSQVGIREPLTITADGTIASGHRRLAAAVAAGLRKIPVSRLDQKRSDFELSEWFKLLRSYNHQRDKNAAVRMKEAAIDLDCDVAYRQLLEERESTQPRFEIPEIQLRDEQKRSAFSDRKLQFVAEIERTVFGLRKFWPLTVRLVHYNLLNRKFLRNSSKGRQRSWYENNDKSYSDLTDMLTRCRMFGNIPWDALADETRTVVGTHYARDAAEFLDVEAYHFLRNYRRDLLQSQPNHIEFVAEKMTMQGIVTPVAKRYCIPTTIGRGYCSSQPRHELVNRFRKSGKKRLIIIVASDFDPDGETIAESFCRSIRDDFGVQEISPIKCLVRHEHTIDLPKSFTKAKKDANGYREFVSKYGDDIYEVESIQPEHMQEIISKAFESVLDLDALNYEIEQEKKDAVKLVAIKREIRSHIQDAIVGGFL